MDNEKKTILSKLYSLRAGLSLIDQQNDILKNEEDKVKKVDERTEENNKMIEYKGKELKYEETQMEGREKELSEANENIERLKRERMFSFAHLLFIAGGGVAGHIAKLLFKPENGEVSWGWIIAGGILGYLICVAISSVGNASMSMHQYKHQAANANKMLSLAKIGASNCENKIEECLSQNEKMAKEKLVAMQTFNEQSLIVIPTVKAMYEALDKEYGPLIDRRDWVNLDLIIYYFETTTL